MIERAGLPKAAQPWSRMRQTNDGTSAIFGGNGGRGGIRRQIPRNYLFLRHKDQI